MKNISEFFIPSNCSDNVIHFNFNLTLFALVRRAPSDNSIILCNCKQSYNKAL